MIQRFLSSVLCVAALAALLTGCASMRDGTFPKMNWAWWKKKDAPEGRHDESLAAPSAKMSPVNSLVQADKSEGAQATATPATATAAATPVGDKPRKPYDTGAGPPAPKSFAGATPDSNNALASSSLPAGTKPSGDVASSGKSGNIPTPRTTDAPGAPLGTTGGTPAESTLAKSMSNSPRKSFELGPPAAGEDTLQIRGSNSYVPGQSNNSTASGVGSLKTPNTSASPLTRAMTPNPYASGGSSGATSAAEPAAATNPLAGAGTSSPLMPNNAGDATPSYARTPYKEFAPKTPNGTPAASGNPTATLNPLQPLGSSAAGNVAAANPRVMSASQPGEIAQVSYTPGSTGGSRPLSELIAASPVSAPAPANTANPSPLATSSPPATQPALSTVPANPPTRAADNTSRLGGGGSFKIVK